MHVSFHFLSTRGDVTSDISGFLPVIALDGGPENSRTRVNYRMHKIVKNDLVHIFLDNPSVSSERRGFKNELSCAEIHYPFNRRALHSESIMR